MESDLTEHERFWIDVIRLASRGTDPRPTLARAQRLRLLFAENGQGRGGGLARLPRVDSGTHDAARPDRMSDHATGKESNSVRNKPRMLQAISRLFGRPGLGTARIAVLIDADGVSPKDAGRAIDQVQSIGRVSILRAYGNFLGGAKTSWGNLLKRRGAVARHMPSVGTGKNATDIALAIDATEILLTKSIDTFVIIASDADFTPLVLRIREEGMDVIGIGGRSAAQSFKDACTAFHDIRSFDTQPIAPPTPARRSRQPAECEDRSLPR